MKSFIAKSTLAAVGLFMFSGAALAADQDFTIVNKTGYPLKHIHVSEATNNSWDEDILGRDILNDGESLDVKFNKADKTCKWDLKVTYDDSETAVWENLNLCQINKVTLRWNKSTGVTSANIE